MPALDGLPNLSSFSVENNSLTGNLPTLTALVHLNYFDVNSNSLSGPIPALTGLTNLREFLAEINSLDRQHTGPRWIDKSAGIRSRPQSAYRSNSCAFAGAPNLSYLSVFNNQLSGAFPDLTGMTHLNALLLGNNRFSGTIPAGALSIPTDLIYFQIGGNGFTGAAPTAPATLTAGQSTLCPNPLDHSADSAWDTATGTSPWYSTCTTQATTVALTTAQNPANQGDIITFDFTVAPTSGSGVPTGMVTLSNDENPATCSYTLTGADDGMKSCFQAFYSAGAHTVYAAYAGDGTFAPSGGTFVVTINKATPSIVAVVPAPDPASRGPHRHRHGGRDQSRERLSQRRGAHGHHQHRRQHRRRRDLHSNAVGNNGRTQRGNLRPRLHDARPAYADGRLQRRRQLLPAPPRVPTKPSTPRPRRSYPRHCSTAGRC